MSAFKQAVVASAFLSLIAINAGCSHGDHDGHPLNSAKPTKTSGFVRTMPPGSSTTVAFLTLENHDDADFIIANVAADIAEQSEIHETRAVDGVLQMRPAKNVTVPANGKLEFTSGGLHIMLMKLEQPPTAGQNVSLIFTATDARQIMVELPVASAAPSSSDPHRNMHH